MARYPKIPEATIRRLSSYLKCLEDLETKGEKVASTALIALICDVNAAQVRKDFAYFGEFGSGQRPGRQAPSAQIVGEPLDGRRQGRGHRIAGSHRRDILLRIHP